MILCFFKDIVSYHIVCKFMYSSARFYACCSACSSNNAHAFYLKSFIFRRAYLLVLSKERVTRCAIGISK